MSKKEPAKPPEELAVADRSRFLTDLNKESDRGCALVAGAWLEDELGRLLRAYFVDDKKTCDVLLGINGPLGTFAGRIHTCFALGLISERDRHNLTTIKDIRNRAAHLRKKGEHQWPDAGFAAKEVALICKNLRWHPSIEVAIQHHREGDPRLLLMLTGFHTGSLSARALFMLMTAMFLMRLNAQARNQKRCQLWAPEQVPVNADTAKVV